MTKTAMLKLQDYLKQNTYIHDAVIQYIDDEEDNDDLFHNLVLYINR